jgi:hypothetical protein
MIKTRLDIFYVPNPLHRNHDREKSQWRITETDEISVFELSHLSNWFSCSNSHSWGLHLQNGQPLILGCSAANAPYICDLRIAKFVRNTHPIYWHGYPANYRIHNQDKPPMPVLNDWQRRGYISKSDKSKIRKGKRCNLSN